MTVEYSSNGAWAHLAALYRDLVPDSLRTTLWHVRHDFLDALLDPMLLVVLAAVLVLERLWPARPNQRLLSVGLTQDVLWWVSRKLFDVTLLATAYVAAENFYQHHLGFLRPEITSVLPLALTTVAAFVLLDFLEWGTHVIRHKVPALWALHALHHSQRELNMFTAARFHPLEELLVNLVRSIPFVIFGASGPVAVFFVLLAQWWSEFQHSNTRISLGPLEYLLASPHWHRIHHSSESRHQDKNFATIFSFWDRLFGTAYAAPQEFPETGIHDERFPLERSARPSSLAGTYLRQLVYPLGQIWHMTTGTRR